MPPQALAPEDLVHGRSHRDQPLEWYLRPATHEAQLGLGSYKSAWLLLHKLRRAMVDPDRSLLEDLIEIDEATLPFRTAKDPGHRRGKVAAHKARCALPARSSYRPRASHAASGWRRSGISPRAAFVPSLPGPRRRARG